MYCNQAFYSIHVTEQFSCTFSEILGTYIGDGDSSHFFVRNSPKFSPSPPLYSIQVCKKITCNFDEILATGIYANQCGSIKITGITEKLLTLIQNQLNFDEILVTGIYVLEKGKYDP